MKRTRSTTRVRTGIVLAAFSLVGLLVVSGAGLAQTQVAPANTSEPQITGTPQVGVRLTATTGIWTGAPTSFHYQWTRCPTSGGASDASDCATLGGATGRRYVPGSNDAGKRLRVKVTAANADGTTTVASNATAIVKATSAKLTNTTPPTISGSPTVGSTLTANLGAWTGNDPITFSESWRRCDSTGGSCAAISGAIEKTYVLKSVDSGNTIRVRVTAKDPGGSISATSVPTAVVGTTPPPVSNGCAKKGGTAPVAGITPPARLLIDQTQVTPSTITYGTRSLTARFHVSGCGGSVEGALVYVTAVPYAMFANANEQATGSDGWATLQFTALAGFPVSQKQAILVMFVRARKSGENLLGGISTRRLVSFAIAHG